MRRRRRRGRVFREHLEIPRVPRLAQDGGQTVAFALSPAQARGELALVREQTLVERERIVRVVLGIPPFIAERPHETFASAQPALNMPCGPDLVRRRELPPHQAERCTLADEIWTTWH